MHYNIYTYTGVYICISNYAILDILYIYMYILCDCIYIYILFILYFTCYGLIMCHYYATMSLYQVLLSCMPLPFGIPGYLRVGLSKDLV